MADPMTELAMQLGIALQDAVVRIVAEAPVVIVGLLIAIIFLIVGYLVGKLFARIVETFLHKAKLDEWASHYDLEKAVGSIPLSTLAGMFVKWYTILLFLAEAAAFVQLAAIRTFVDMIVFYVPALLGALLIIVLGLLIGRYLRNQIENTKHKYKSVAGLVTQWLVIYVTLVIGLDTMGFNTSILTEAFKIAFSAMVFIIAIVIGVSFGLTFKNELRQFWLELRKEFK